MTKEELLENVRENEYTGDGTISVHIRHIREKLEPDPGDPAIIKTVRSVGYVVEQNALVHGDGA